MEYPGLGIKVESPGNRLSLTLSGFHHQCQAVGMAHLSQRAVAGREASYRRGPLQQSSAKVIYSLEK